MSPIRKTNRQAADALAALLDDDVSAVHQEEEMSQERAEVDALIESVDRELAAEARAEAVRVAASGHDQVRARRVRRRADREVPRSLPTRLPAADVVGDWFEGEAA
ncbi:MAG: hypothetical protein ACRDQ7_09320 [Haloechinothrix sp.]